MLEIGTCAFDFFFPALFDQRHDVIRHWNIVEVGGHFLSVLVAPIKELRAAAESASLTGVDCIRMNVEPATGHEVAPGAFVMMTWKSGALVQSAPAAAAWNAAAVGATVLPAAVDHPGIVQVVLHGVGVFDIAKRANNLPCLVGNTLTTLAPMPTGHSTAVFSPTLLFHSGLTLER